MDSLGFKKSLLPPPPLGYFQTPLGENLNTGEILSFSFDEEKQPFGRLNSESIQEVKLPTVQSKKENLYNFNSQNISNEKISSEVMSDNINSHPNTNLEAVTESTVFRQPLGQSLPLVKESNLATYNLAQELLSSEIQRKSQNATQNLSDSDNDKSVDYEYTNPINSTVFQAKSELISTQKKSALINTNTENIDSRKTDIQRQEKIIPDSQDIPSIKPLPQIIDNINVDNSSTAIQPQLENQQQLRRQSLSESQSIESLPINENIQPSQNQDIIQSQSVESQPRENRVENDSLVSENDNQIVKSQKITTPKKPQFDSITTDIDVENSRHQYYQYL